MLDKLNPVDQMYHDALEFVLHNGSTKDTRAGEAISAFPLSIAFDLRYGFPALTTKKLFFKGVKAELIWFLKGNTNIKELVDENVHIWDDDAYRGYLHLTSETGGVSKEEFLEKVRKQDRIETIDYTYGDLGPVYGAQWRGENGKHPDQIGKIIEKLKENPDDRRMIVDAWNIDELDGMVLPPCHYSFQIYTAKASRHDIEYFKMMNPQYKDEKIERRLSLLWNQRSCDMFLGLPFNIASYALLAHMLAKEVHMIPYSLHASLGDCHIYKNQLQAVKEQLGILNSYNPPTLWLNKEVRSIFDYGLDDIRLDGYESHPAIKAPLSVGL